MAVLTPQQYNNPVNYGASDFSGAYPSSPQNSYQPGGGTTAQNSTPGYSQPDTNPVFGGALGAINTFNQARNSGAIKPQAGGQPSGGTTPTNTFGTSSWTPGFQQNLGGYNPSQYANLDTTNQLAQALGGNALQTRMGPGSPFNVPPQNSIDFGGDSPLNAGLLAERYQKYDKATADAMTRAELAMQGPRQNPNEDSQGGSMGSWSQFQALPGGTKGLGGGANLGSSVGDNQGWRNAGGAGNGGAAPGGGINQFSYSPQQQGYPQQYSSVNNLNYGGQTNQSPWQIQQNFGGFGPASNFAQANQGGNPLQMLMQLFGGGGGNLVNTLNTRGRMSPFGYGGGPMSSQIGFNSPLSGYNQIGGNGFRGFGGGQYNPYGAGSMSGLAGMMNSFQPNYGTYRAY